MQYKEVIIALRQFKKTGTNGEGYWIQGSTLKSGAATVTGRDGLAILGRKFILKVG